MHLQMFKLVLKSLDREWTDRIIFRVEGVNVLDWADSDDDASLGARSTSNPPILRHD